MIGGGLYDIPMATDWRLCLPDIGGVRMRKYYKVLSEKGAAYHGGKGRWSLPTKNKPAKWMPEIGDISPCERGYHLCRRNDLIEWLGPVIWLVEPGGIIVEAGNKVVTNRARLIKQLNWDKRIARLFAADCAEHVLCYFEERYPEDKRPRNAIDITRKFANGQATQKDLAAWDSARAAAAWAAWDAAGDAARDAAWAAASAAAGDAWDSARAAEWAAARDAAGDAARDAARAAERKWQTRRLFEYLNGRRGTKP